MSPLAFPRTGLWFIVSLALFFPQSSLGSNECSKEKGGNIVVQVETANPSSKWVLATDIPGYTGDGYFTWTGRNEYDFRWRGILKYRICVKGGSYRVNLRSMRTYKEGLRNDEGNDAWVHTGQEWIKLFTDFGPLQNTWQWSKDFDLPNGTKIPPIVELEGGCQNFKIAPRSEQFSIDRITLQKVGTKLSWSGNSTPCSQDDEEPESEPFVPNCWMGKPKLPRGDRFYLQLTNRKSVAVRVWKTSKENRPKSMVRIGPGESRQVRAWQNNYIAVTQKNGKCLFSDRLKAPDTSLSLDFKD